MFHRIQRMLAALSFLLLVSVSQTAAAVDEKPIVIVKSTITRILKTLADDSLSEEQTRNRVAEITRERINYYEMSRRILAVNWAKAGPEQQRRFVELFTEILTNTYWSRIKKYRNEEVVYFTSSIEQEVYATVDTVIQSETIEIPVTYRLKYTNGKWLAYDFLVEGASLIGTYRASFAEIIKNHGMDQLLKEMAEKVREPA